MRAKNIHHEFCRDLSRFFVIVAAMDAGFTVGQFSIIQYLFRFLLSLLFMRFEKQILALSIDIIHT